MIKSNNKVDNILSNAAEINLRNIEAIYLTKHKRLPTKEEIEAYNLGFIMGLKNVAKAK